MVFIDLPLSSLCMDMSSGILQAHLMELDDPNCHNSDLDPRAQDLVVIGLHLDTTHRCEWRPLVPNEDVMGRWREERLVIRISGQPVPDDGGNDEVAVTER